MANEPKQLTENFLPGLGDQHVIGGSGLGVSVVDCTVAVNTSQTDAEIIAAISNLSGVAGSIVHSLRVAPSLVIPMLSGQADGGSALHFNVGLSYITADNSAVYIRAKSFTGALGGTRVRVIAVR